MLNVLHIKLPVDVKSISHIGIKLLNGVNEATAFNAVLMLLVLNSLIPSIMGWRHKSIKNLKR